MPDSPRQIVARTRGQRQGPITRLMSPGDMGQMLKPFVFLDYVEAEGTGPGFGFHPHSGIATLTFPLTFDIEHTTSTGQVDTVARGGIEWVVAGSGIWHKARPLNGQRMLAFQTWFALPPTHELSPPSAMFLQTHEVPRAGHVTLLLGSYENMHSKIDAPFDACFLWVQLPAGERWTYQPAREHGVAWAFAQSGDLEVSGERLNRELAVFEEGGGALHFQAHGDCAFLVASAAKSPQELSLGRYSVHSSPVHLAAGEKRIQEIGAALKQ
ncbi:MAG: pirin family protein [Betaproteobacteria bacterium]|nr:pirin family protein [Betaproteobacteria bacterium]